MKWRKKDRKWSKEERRGRSEEDRGRRGKREGKKKRRGRGKEEMTERGREREKTYNISLLPFLSSSIPLFHLPSSMSSSLPLNPTFPPQTIVRPRQLSSFSPLPSFLVFVCMSLNVFSSIGRRTNKILFSGRGKGPLLRAPHVFVGVKRISDPCSRFMNILDHFAFCLVFIARQGRNLCFLCFICLSLLSFLRRIRILV